MSGDDETTTPSDARAALASVTASELAIRKRSIWPFWLSILVATSFGTYNALRTYFSADRSAYVEVVIALTCILPVFLVWLLFFRWRGLVVRDTFRWASALIVTAAFVIEARSVVLDAQAAILFGTFNAMLILLFWGIADGLSSLMSHFRDRRKAHAGR